MTEQVKESLSAWLDGEASEIEIHRLVRHYSAGSGTGAGVGAGSEKNEPSVNQSGAPGSSVDASITSSITSFTTSSMTRKGLMYQHVRTVMRREQGQARVSHEAHVALHARISSAIAEEPVHTLTGGTFFDKAAVGKAAVGKAGNNNRPAWIKPVGGLAAAASLVVAVFVGLQLDLQSGPGLNSPAGELAGRQSAPVAVQTVGTQGGTVSGDYPGSATYADASGPATQQTELKTLDEEKQRQLRAYLRQHDQMTRMNPNARTVIYTPPSQP